MNRSHRWSYLTNVQLRMIESLHGIDNITQEVFVNLPSLPIEEYIFAFSPRNARVISEQMGMVVPNGISLLEYVVSSLYLYGDVVENGTTTANSTDKDILKSLEMIPIYTNREQLESEAEYFIEGNAGFFYISSGELAFGTYKNYEILEELLNRLSPNGTFTSKLGIPIYLNNSQINQLYRIHDLMDEEKSIIDDFPQSQRFQIIPFKPEEPSILQSFVGVPESHIISEYASFPSILNNSSELLCVLQMPGVIIGSIKEGSNNKILTIDQLSGRIISSIDLPEEHLSYFSPESLNYSCGKLIKYNENSYIVVMSSKEVYLITLDGQITEIMTLNTENNLSGFQGNRFVVISFNFFNTKRTFNDSHIPEIQEVKRNVQELKLEENEFLDITDLKADGTGIIVRKYGNGMGDFKYLDDGVYFRKIPHHPNISSLMYFLITYNGFSTQEAKQYILDLFNAPESSPTYHLNFHAITNKGDDFVFLVTPRLGGNLGIAVFKSTDNDIPDQMIEYPSMGQSQITNILIYGDLLMGIGEKGMLYIWNYENRSYVGRIQGKETGSVIGIFISNNRIISVTKTHITEWNLNILSYHTQQVNPISSVAPTDDGLLIGFTDGNIGKFLINS